jgi:hypothetical protein
VDFASIWLNILTFLNIENFFFVENICFLPLRLFCPRAAAQFAHSLHPKEYHWVAALSKIVVI